MKALPYARKREILEMLKRSDYVDINQLSQKFNVSYMTIHRDLKELEDQGAVSRIYGGVTASETPPAGGTAPDLTLEERFRVCQAEKHSMALAAAEYVRDGEIVCLDASTSALQLCPLLHDRKITVVTNGLNIAMQFADSETVNVIVLGGLLRKSSLSLSGVRDLDLLRHINIQKCFLSATALSFEKGVTELSFEESEIKREMLARCDQFFLLADHTKLGAAAPYVDCTCERIYAVVTDRNPVGDGDGLPAKAAGARRLGDLRAVSPKSKTKGMFQYGCNHNRDPYRQRQAQRGPTPRRHHRPD
jgi:DeoR/GlpR family transcriptional regulator of sugar metabolism